MIDNEDSVQLSEYCFSMCETLKMVVQGANAGDLDDSATVAIKDLERCADRPWLCLLTKSSNFRLTRELERTLRRGANSPQTKYNKEKVEGYKLEIQQILQALHAPRNENSVAESVIPVAQGHSDSIATTPAAESGMSLPHPFVNLPLNVNYGSIHPHFLIQQHSRLASDQTLVHPSRPPLPYRVGLCE